MLPLSAINFDTYIISWGVLSIFSKAEDDVELSVSVTGDELKFCQNRFYSMFFLQINVLCNPWLLFCMETAVHN